MDQVDREIAEEMNGLPPWAESQIHFVFETRARRKVISMVKLLHVIPHDEEYAGWGQETWLVEHILSGRREQIGEPYMSFEIYNEMEAIAWAATQ